LLDGERIEENDFQYLDKGCHFRHQIYL